MNTRITGPDVIAAAPVAGRAFRPDIQALRAVAVSAVVLYHFWPDQVRGGFIGVDVFFVISGFLITQHLFGELARTGRIALTQFWARRIRRLLPASLTVLAVSVLVLLLAMPTVVWAQNLQEIRASAAYVENWLLGFDAIDYLASGNTPSIVQHYWSLSVEEQFYLVWPLLLLLAVGIARRIRRRASLRSAVIIALVVVGAVSLVVSIVETAAQPALAFFATPTRAWEFAAGALISTAPITAGFLDDRRVRAAASWLGLALIIGSCFLINGTDVAFPGSIALIPVAGAALVLFGGTSGRAWSPDRLAALAPVQWIGGYSYSLYLWHWPLITAAPYLLDRAPTWYEKLLLLLLAGVLTLLTKRFVEDPIRTGVWWRKGRARSYSLAVVGMAVLLTITTIWVRQMDDQHVRQDAVNLQKITSGAPCYGAEAMVQTGCASPFALPADLDPAFGAADIDNALDACQQNINLKPLILCNFGDTKDPTTTIAVVGNSHALRLVPALDLYGKEHHWKIVLAAKTNCMGLISAAIGDKGPDPSCLAWSASLSDKLLSMPGLTAVIFASHASSGTYLVGDNPSDQDLAVAKERVVATWSSFAAKGIKVIVTEDVPGTRPYDTPTCIAQSKAKSDPCAQPRSEVVVGNFMSDLAQQHGDLVNYVKVSQYFCDSNLCHALVGGVIVYSDAHHLTTTYSRSMAQYLGGDVSRILVTGVS